MFGHLPSGFLCLELFLGALQSFFLSVQMTLQIFCGLNVLPTDHLLDPPVPEKVTLDSSFAPLRLLKPAN